MSDLVPEERGAVDRKVVEFRCVVATSGGGGARCQAGRGVGDFYNVRVPDYTVEAGDLF